MLYHERCNLEATTHAEQAPPILILIAGDALLILFFSWLGRITHHLPADLPSVLQTAFPFLAAWLFTAPSFGLYRQHPPGLAAAAVRTSAAVLIGVTAGVLFRAWLLGRPFDWLFYSVTFLTLLFLFLLWRLPFAWWFLRRSADDGDQPHA